MLARIAATLGLVAIPLAAQASCTNIPGPCSNMGNNGGGCSTGTTAPFDLFISWTNQTVLFDILSFSVVNAPPSGVGPFPTLPFVIYVAGFSTLGPAGVAFPSCGCTLLPSLDDVRISISGWTYYVPQGFSGTLMLQAVVLAAQGGCTELNALGQFAALTDAWSVTI